MTNHKGAAVQVRAEEDTWLRHAVMAIFVLFTALLLALPSIAGAQEYKFDSVKVEGNQRIESAAILNYAGIEKGQVVTAGQLNGAYQRILDSGLFETVEVFPRGSRLEIKVVEYPTINRINFDGRFNNP